METMPAPKSPSGGSRGSSGKTAKSSTTRRRRKSPPSDGRGGVTDGITGLAEQVTNGILKPLGLVVLTTERIQEVLDDAADRGRVTRSDANDLVEQLVTRGRQQTDQLLSDVERLIGRGRHQVSPASRGSRWSESIHLLVQQRRPGPALGGVGQSFPILGYDDLTATQVQARLQGLAPAELRKVREYERRHANRKSVLAAIDKTLAPR